MNRPQLGRDLFARGEPEAVEISRRSALRSESLRSACGLRPSGAEARPRSCALQGARGLVACAMRARRWRGWSGEPMRLDRIRRLASRGLPRSKDAPQRPRVHLFCVARTGARGKDRAPAGKNLRADLDPRRGAAGLRAAAPHDGRILPSAKRGDAMGRMTVGSKIAQLFDAIAPRPSPEDVRIAEAMVFASAEPLEEAAIAARLSDGAAVGAVMEELRALRRPRRQSRTGRAGAGRSGPLKICPGCWRAKTRTSESSPAQRSRRWRSSPIISRSPAPTSRRSAASPCPKAPWTF